MAMGLASVFPSVQFNDTTQRTKSLQWVEAGV